MPFVAPHVFGYRLPAAVYLITGVGTAPYALYHLLAEELATGAASGALSALLVIGAYLIYRNPERTAFVNSLTALGMLLANVVVLLSLFDLGGVAVYWAFPLTVANFFILTPSVAAALSALQLLVVLLVLQGSTPPSHLVRIATALPISGLFAYLFASFVQRQREELARLATHDSLTGAGNRRALDEAIEEAVNRHRRYSERVALVLIDLDHFKEINDNHGHPVGDELMIEVVTRIRRRIRRGDGLYRYGGEELMVLLPHTDYRQGARLAEDLRRVVAESPVGPVESLTLSAGVAEHRAEESGREWVERCDRALYQAQRAGRNRVEVAPARSEALRATSR